MNKTPTTVQKAQGLVSLLRARQTEIDDGARAGVLLEGEGTALLGQAADVIMDLMQLTPGAAGIEGGAI